MKLLHEELTEKIIAAFYAVYHDLGYGFLEKVYLNAMLIELMERGCFCEKQQLVTVYYKGHIVGEYFADQVIESKVIVEIKASEFLVEAHENQLQNYLRATEVEVGLLLNFGKKPEFRRKIFTNDKKQIQKMN